MTTPDDEGHALYRPMANIFMTDRVVTCERADCHAPTRFALGVVTSDGNEESEEGRVIDICLTHLEEFVGGAVAEGLVEDD